MGKRAAFTWTEKGEARLASFTCECGEDIIGTGDDPVDVMTDIEAKTRGEDGTRIDCPECDRTYKAEYVGMKMVETDNE